MITMRKSTHGFPFLSLDEYGATPGGPLGHQNSAIKTKEQFGLTARTCFQAVSLHLAIKYTLD